jgi:Ras-related protein Rab-7A
VLFAFLGPHLIPIVGSSSLLSLYRMRRFVQGDFNPERRATIGADFMTTEMDLGGTSALLQIWDTAGTERFMRYATLL